MKTIFKLLISFLVLFSFTNLEAQKDLTISWDYSGLDFGRFVSTAQSRDSIRFFYMEEWVSDLKLGEYKGPVLLAELLDNLFGGKSLYYYFDNKGDVIITKGYIVKSAETESDSSHLYIPSGENNEQDNSQISATNVIEVGNPANKNKSGNVILSGYITNRDTKDPLAGVTVFNQKLSLGTISNGYGFYSLSMPSGSHLIQFSFIGMKGKSFTINLNGTGEMNVEMTSMLIPLKETIISAERNMILRSYEVGVEKVNLTSFSLLPT